MKTQMRVQKILMLVSLVVSALVFVYALFFLTGGLADVYRFIDETDGDLINCTNFVNTSQNFVSTLITLSIIMIVLVAVMYLMACGSRRKYYITNYIAVGVFVVFALAVAIYLVAMVATTMNLYQHDILWKSGEGDIYIKIIESETSASGVETIMANKNYADIAQFYPAYVLDPNQSYNFIIGFVVFVIVIADAVCVALCTVWKYLLVKGEYALLANGAPATETVAAEVAVTENVETAEIENPVKEEE